MTTLPPGTISNDVLVGTGDELFLAGGAHSVLDFVTGQREVPERSFQRFGTMIQQRAALCARAGVAYRHLIFPDKQTVLADRFPLGVPISLGATYLERCAEAAPHLLFPCAALQAGERRTYLRTDTHVTTYGSMLVATLTAEALTGESQAARLPELLRSLGPMRAVEGDLGSKLEPPQSSEDHLLDAAWRVAAFSNRFASGNNGIVDLYVAPDAPYAKRLLIFGDSFGRSMGRIFSFFFREVAFLRTPFLHRDIFQQMRPDLLLTENVERYLTNVQGDEMAPSFHMYPYLARRQVAYDPPREFAEAFSAFLSYPRRPYQDFIKAQMDIAAAPPQRARRRDSPAPR